MSLIAAPVLAAGAGVALVSRARHAAGIGRARAAGAPPLLVAGMLAAGCGGAKTTVPPVDTTNLGLALTRLHAAGLRAQVDSFHGLQPGMRLEEASVGDQDPEAGTRVRRNSVVRLTMGVNPLPSPGTAVPHPRFAIVPHLVGLRWPEAERRIGGGLWLEISRIAPLPADKSARGLSAFTVASQRPAPGTRVPYMGVRIPHGVDMRPSTLTLTMAVP